MNVKTKLKATLFLFVACFMLSCSDQEELIESSENLQYSTSMEFNSIPSSILEEISVDSIQSFDEVISGVQESKRLGLKQNYTDFLPTGVYVKPNAQLTLNVNLIAGTKTPKILVGTYLREADQRAPLRFFTQEGINTINVGPYGGMVYVRYTTLENPVSKAEITFIDGWEHTPVYKKNQTSNLSWRRMLYRLDSATTATLVGDKSFVVVSREVASEYRFLDQEALLDGIDSVITTQQNLSGMDSSEAIHNPTPHKLMLTEHLGSDYFMFASGYGTAYRQSDTMEFILDSDEFNTNGWGPWHEIGHMHQMSSWTWSAMDEVSGNIYALASEKNLGITPSRFKRENRWNAVENHLALPDNAQKNVSKAANGWVRLGMFYQLHLAFGDSFYQNLHKNLRKDALVLNTNQEKIHNFMIYACQAANKDLTDFFKKWGLKHANVNQTYADIAALQLPQLTEDITLIQD